jgi:hypothetical protein
LLLDSTESLYEEYHAFIVGNKERKRRELLLVNMDSFYEEYEVYCSGEMTFNDEGVSSEESLLDWQSDDNG